jgi:predicted RNA-binding Zn ribbon-like protein
MATHYAGPLRQEPISIELHNTLYATATGPVDGLADPLSAAAFLEAIAPRLEIAPTAPGKPPGPSELSALRDAVRAVLGAAADDMPQDPDAVASLNRAAAAAPISVRAELDGPRWPEKSLDRHGASRSAIALAAFATDAIELVTGPAGGQIRRCGAPGCVLLYLATDPRKRWCSNTCGNRARQSRHYRRTHRRP